MPVKRSNNRGQWAVRMLCVLAMLFLGFAHQPVAMAADAPLDVSAYALPDGSLPILCVSDDGGSQKDKDKHLFAQGCDACRISASVLLPQPADDVGRIMRHASTSMPAPKVAMVPRRIFSPATAPRAPPLA
jgi:hypothetical protein